MRLDHISYVASHDQISDVVNRIGSQIGTAFVDGGIHPKFGTRNFTAPLLNGQYIEVVCPLNHPATDATPFGKAVKKKAEAGGGWLTWVFSAKDLAKVEEKFGRKAADGSRTKPDGSELRWKQIGVKEITGAGELPFFIQWLTEQHPSKDGNSVAKISKLVIADDEQLADSWFKEEIKSGLKDVVIEWVKPEVNDGDKGIVAVELL
ncbi:MAG: VOC family protein, partial [Candidatus Nanopelagicus sp.]